MKKYTWIFIGIIVAIILIFIYSDSQSSQSITIYPVQCEAPNVTDFSNCKNPQALEVSEYFIDQTNKTVTIEYPSESNVPIEKPTDCTVIDSSNWSCGSGDGLMNDFGFKNGNYYSDQWTTNGGKLSIIYVNKNQWDSINNGQDGPIN